ncbi:hypothetical protein ABZ896_10695 [Streptomyces sp. NPDC047072]|uniref:hypothetical protein n=1 Tax=Streptomyces sp. NPDC047072 TaxID=3154809 RepID=UPI0033D119FA
MFFMVRKLTRLLVDGSLAVVNAGSPAQASLPDLAVYGAAKVPCAASAGLSPMS